MFNPFTFKDLDKSQNITACIVELFPYGKHKLCFLTYNAKPSSITFFQLGKIPNH